MFPRVIFWNAGGLGWSIGKTAYLSSGSYWHRSGLESDEPWQGEWDKSVSTQHTDTVSVECIEEANFNSASFTQRMNHILYVIVLCYMVLKDTKE